MEEIPNNHLGCIKHVNNGIKLPTSTGAGFLPSTVSLFNRKLFGKMLGILEMEVGNDVLLNGHRFDRENVSHVSLCSTCSWITGCD